MLKSFFSCRIASASCRCSASSEPTSCGYSESTLHTGPGQPTAAWGRAGPDTAGARDGREPTAGPRRGKGRTGDGGATAGPTRRTPELSFGSLSKGRSTAIPAGDDAVRPPARRNSNAGRAPPGADVERRGGACRARRARLPAGGRGRCGAGGDRLTGRPGWGGTRRDRRVQLLALHRGHTTGLRSPSGHSMCLTVSSERFLNSVRLDAVTTSLGACCCARPPSG